MMMRLLLFSDIHGSARALSWMEECIAEHAPDAVLIAGDLTHFGPPDFVDEISALPGRILAVNGNCDTREVVSRITASRIDAIERLVNLGHLAVIGIGWHVGSPALHRVPDRLIQQCEKGPEGRRIVLSHSPAFGFLDEPSPGHHIGSRALLEFVRVIDPELVITGHVHEASGIVQGRPTFVNPGPAKNMGGFVAEVGAEGTKVEPL